MSHGNAVRGLLLAAIAMAAVAPSTANADYNVRGKGRLVYKDGSSTKPLGRVRVQLMDQDIDFDEVMAKGWTDGDGKFDLSGAAEDDFTLCDGCDKPDPYMKFILNDNSRVDVYNLWGYTHFGLSKTKEDKAGTIDFGDCKFDNDEKLYPLLFAYAQQQYAKFRAETGEEKIPGNDGMVGVLVPEVIEAGAPYTGTENIHWPGDYTDATGIFHEFGHRIRHAADGGDLHFSNDNTLFRYMRAHGLYMDGKPFRSNLGFAFNEGWAIYHSTLLDAESREEVERWEHMTSNSGEYEGEVAWNLFHLADQCGGFKPMWRALKSAQGKDIDGGPALAQSGIHSWTQFRKWFLAKNPSCKFVPPSQQTGSSSAALAKPHHAMKQVGPKIGPALASMDRADMRVVAPVSKWSKARLAKLPEDVRAPMKRISDRRLAAYGKHDANVRAVHRKAIEGLAAATADSISDGSRAKQLAAVRDRIIADTGKPRLAQIDAITAELRKEAEATRDPRFRKYVERLVAKYAAQAAEIRAAMAKPGSRIPDSLVPRTLGSPVTTEH